MSVPRKLVDVTELDQWFRPCGQCLFCGFEDKRHRIWDVIMERHKHGDSVEDIADDLMYDTEAIEAVLRIRPYEFDPYFGVDEDEP